MSEQAMADADRDAIIKKAARAIALVNESYNIWVFAEAAINAACPGLLDGTHWLAPMEATDAMRDAYLDSWAIMRDTYLGRPIDLA